MARLDPDILRFYSRTDERGRLGQGPFRLEWMRTLELIFRHLPKPPARVLDVGGGPGAYACFLARHGYEVTLVDPVPLHVEQARAACEDHRDRAIASAEPGDARDLTRFAEGSFDAVLCLGPLYHLTEKKDRVRALGQGVRVLKEGGVLMAAAISRYASLLDGMVRGILSEPGFGEIVANDLATGQHRNPSGDPAWFTTAYFHHADELLYEALEAGLDDPQVLGIEGPGWLLQDLDRRLADDDERDILIHAARAVETAEELIGLSAHLMVVGRRG